MSQARENFQKFEELIRQIQLFLEEGVNEVNANQFNDVYTEAQILHGETRGQFLQTFQLLEDLGIYYLPSQTREVTMRFLAQFDEFFTDDDEDEDGTPPMEPEEIADISSVMVDQKMLDKSSICPICLVELMLMVEVKVLPCGHFFHGSCIDTWLGLHGSCPLCRGVEVGEKEG